MRILAVAVVLAVALPARAQTDATSDTQSYRVRQGDTLDLIAAEFYGDRTHAIFIMVENKMQHARALHPGERLKIPTTREITTAKGDTFESLAQTYLGDARRAHYLADFNTMSPEDSLAAGTTLTIPFHVTHVAAATESLAQIALTYFQDAKQADLLRDYNGLDRTQLDKGESLIVPILHVRVRPGRLPPIDAEAKSRREQQAAAKSDAAIALPRARTAWLQGDFAGVKAALARVADEIDFLDTADAGEIALLLGKAHVAFDEVDLAVESFSQVLNRRPRELLNAYAESPKVIAVWKKAGGHVEGE